MGMLQDIEETCFAANIDDCIFLRFIGKVNVFMGCFFRYDKFQSDLAKQGGASNDEAKQVDCHNLLAAGHPSSIFTYFLLTMLGSMFIRSRASCKCS